MSIELYLKAFAIALIEGLTEFIPVSSTGHMILLGDLIEFQGEVAHSYEIFIQLGAILAALWVYKEQYLNLLPKKGESLLHSLFFGSKGPTGLHIALGIVPILIGGFLFHKTIKSELFSSHTVALGLVVGGVLMILFDLLAPKVTTEKVEEMTQVQAGIIGLGQCLALWPGMSRSGSCMIAGIFGGMKHKAAADFSFIIAIPVMTAAVGYDLLKSWKFLSLGDIPLFLLGFVTAFFVALLSIRWFLRVLGRLGLLPFGVYRLLVGGATLVFAP